MEIKSLSGEALNPVLEDRQSSVLPSSIMSEEVSSPAFGNLLQQAIEKVNTMQKTSAEKMHQIETGASQDLLGTLLASQKAGISFQALLQVRNKAVSAYEEIMRMQI